MDVRFERPRLARPGVHIRGDAVTANPTAMVSDTTGEDRSTLGRKGGVVRGIDLTKVMQRSYASEINCAVQGQWDAGFVVSIGGDTRYASSDASETFAAGELAEAAAWLDRKARELYPESDYAGRSDHP